MLDWWCRQCFPGHETVHSLTQSLTHSRDHYGSGFALTASWAGSRPSAGLAHSICFLFFSSEPNEPIQNIAPKATSSTAFSRFWAVRGTWRRTVAWACCLNRTWHRLQTLQHRIPWHRAWGFRGPIGRSARYIRQTNAWPCPPRPSCKTPICLLWICRPPRPTPLSGF